MIIIFGCFSNTFTNSANSSLVYTDPVGLQGVLNKNPLVLEVITSSTCLATVFNLLYYALPYNSAPVSPKSSNALINSKWSFTLLALQLCYKYAKLFYRGTTSKECN